MIGKPHTWCVNFYWTLQHASICIHIMMLRQSKLRAGWLGARSEPWWWSPVFSRLLRPVTHHLAMDCAADAVVQLGVQLRQRISIIHGGLWEIPNCRRLNNVPDDKFFDRLVFRDTSRTVCTTYRVHMTAALLGTTSVSSLLRHYDQW